MAKPNYMRLNKFIAHYSTYSRREADRAIQDGYVRIDGEVEDNPATQVDENATGIYISGKQVIASSIYTVIVYNKPKGELVTKNDPQGRRIIYDSLDAKFKHFISVGRLDYATDGLLLLTDASKVASTLMHSKLERVYKVKIKGKITESMENGMRGGLTVEKELSGAHELSDIDSMVFAPFYAYDIIKNQGDYSIIKIVIGEGQNREIRRFFEHFGTKVMDLRRLSYGGIELNNLPEGKSRYLSRSEYGSLKDYIKVVDQAAKERADG